jgi:hypothetical protein
LIWCSFANLPQETREQIRESVVEEVSPSGNIEKLAS